MSSSGYIPWAVTAGEVPTTAYWNILGSNDASFNSGTGFNDGAVAARHLSSSAFLAVYPVGAIYISTVNTNPGTIFGGTWVAYSQGTVLAGYQSGSTDFGTGGQTGGSSTHWHWQTLGNDGGGVYMAVAGYAPALGAAGNSTVISINRSTFGSGSTSTAGARFDGTGTASSYMPYITVFMFNRTA